MRVSVHGDDFTSLGTFAAVSWFHAEVAKHWLVEIRGILGPPGMPGTVHEVRHLNRLIAWDTEGITWECDPRHVELLLRDVGVTGSVTTPLVKEKVDALDSVDSALSSEDNSLYRSRTMRLGYIAQDRTDVQRTTRELAKGMAPPCARHEMMLKRAVRYLLHAPRVRLRWKYQRRLTRIDIYSDTDHAGCIRTRKSTSGVVAMLGPNLMHSLCRGQAVIALSSGEAEYYGLVTGISEGLGYQSLAKDFGVALKIHVWMDARAGAAIGSRRGLGKVKHIDTIFLWVQDFINQQKVTLGKKHTSENLADVLTKLVDASTLRKFMVAMGFEYLEGKSSLGYKA